MQAHLRTEAFLKDLKSKGQIEYTIIREGLYNESWPLYLGYYSPKEDKRDEIVLAGDGKISWTAISDLGLGTALVLADESGKWREKTFYLSNVKESKSLKEIAALVGEIKGISLSTKIASRKEYVSHYIEGEKEAPGVEVSEQFFSLFVVGVGLTSSSGGVRRMGLWRRANVKFQMGH